MEHDPAERRKFLQEACEDAAMRGEVESLLATHKESFLEKSLESSVVSRSSEDGGSVDSGLAEGSRFLHYRIIKY